MHNKKVTSNTIEVHSFDSLLCSSVVQKYNKKLSLSIEGKIQIDGPLNIIMELSGLEMYNYNSLRENAYLRNA